MKILSLIRERVRPEFSWRAAFIGAYVTPELDKLWITLVPFFPIYVKLKGGADVTHE